MLGYLVLKKSNVSSLVEKLFINMNLTFCPNSFLMHMTCLAVKSKKVSPFFTSSKLLALSRPIPVPNPPLSLSTTVWERRAALGSDVMESVCTRPGTGVMVDSGMNPVLPDTRELKDDSKAEMADWAMPSATIFACYREGKKQWR